MKASESEWSNQRQKDSIDKKNTNMEILGRYSQYQVLYLV